MLATLTNGLGDHAIWVEIEYEGSGRSVFSTARQPRIIGFPSPVIMREIIITIGGPLLMEPGRYWLKLYASGTLVAQRPFTALAPPPPNPAVDAPPPERGEDERDRAPPQKESS